MPATLLPSQPSDPVDMLAEFLHDSRCCNGACAHTGQRCCWQWTNGICDQAARAELASLAARTDLPAQAPASPRGSGWSR